RQRRHTLHAPALIARHHPAFHPRAALGDHKAIHHKLPVQRCGERIARQIPLRREPVDKAHRNQHPGVQRDLVRLGRSGGRRRSRVLRLNARGWSCLRLRFGRRRRRRGGPGGRGGGGGPARQGMWEQPAWAPPAHPPSSAALPRPEAGSRPRGAYVPASAPRVPLSPPPPEMACPARPWLPPPPAPREAWPARSPAAPALAPPPPRAPPFAAGTPPS